MAASVSQLLPRPTYPHNIFFRNFDNILPIPPLPLPGPGEVHHGEALLQGLCTDARGGAPRPTAARTYRSAEDVREAQPAGRPTRTPG